MYLMIVGAPVWVDMAYFFPLYPNVICCGDVAWTAGRLPARSPTGYASRVSPRMSPRNSPRLHSGVESPRMPERPDGSRPYVVGQPSDGFQNGRRKVNATMVGPAGFPCPERCFRDY